MSDPGFHPVAAGTPGAQTLVLNPSVSLLIDSKAGGGLWALKLETGEEVWLTPHPGCGDVPGCSPAQSAAVTAIPGLVFSGGLDGRLRAYFAENGKIAWDVDTKGDYQAVNGVPAKGGSIDGGGAVVVDGMVTSVPDRALLERCQGMSCSLTQSMDCDVSASHRFCLMLRNATHLQFFSPPSAPGPSPQPKAAPFRRDWRLRRFGRLRQGGARYGRSAVRIWRWRRAGRPRDRP